MKLLFSWILILTSSALVLACQGKNSNWDDVANSKTEVQDKQDAPANTENSIKCDNGDSPQILSGDCSGSWSVKKVESATQCEFEWKPAIQCPQGTKAMGLQAACYGVTIRPAAPNTKTAEDCLMAHGKFPIAPAYKLECCPST